MHLSTEAYDVFEQVFQGKDNAKKVMRALEEAIVTTVHDSWYRTKEELKAEVFSHFATKDDLQQVRTELLAEMKKDKAELIGKIGAVYEKTERDKTELLGKMEKDKAELLGKMEKDKAELVGMITNVHTELTGKFESLYEKTEKDKAELLGKMEKDKAELLGKMEKDKAELLGKMEKDKAELVGMITNVHTELNGKFEALYEKTEKDKAELSGKIEALFAKTEKDKAELNEKIENVKSEMLLRFEKIDKKFSLFFALLLFAIIFLNQNALEFIAKVIGIIR